MLGDFGSFSFDEPMFASVDGQDKTRQDKTERKAVPFNFFKILFHD